MLDINKYCQFSIRCYIKWERDDVDNIEKYASAISLASAMMMG